MVHWRSPTSTRLAHEDCRSTQMAKSLDALVGLSAMARCAYTDRWHALMSSAAEQQLRCIPSVFQVSRNVQNVMVTYHGGKSSAHRPQEALSFKPSIWLPTRSKAKRLRDGEVLPPRISWTYVQNEVFRSQGEDADDEGNGKSSWATRQPPDQSGASMG